MIDKNYPAALYPFVIAIFLFTVLSFAEEATSKREVKAANIIMNKNNGRCTDCHKNEVAAWKKTKHFNSLDSLTFDTENKAGEIMGELKLKGNARDQQLCGECHFTDKISKFEDSKPVAIPEMGISCESCHQPAKSWVEIHSLKNWDDFNEKFTEKYKNAADKKELLSSFHLASIDALKQLKSKDFIKWRATETDKTGQIKAADIYALINNCYECHTIAKKELINRSSHTAGSEFEILSWLNGEIRHNFQDAAPQNPHNRKISQERKRLLFLSGKLLFAEHSINALKTATFPATEDDDSTAYFDAMIERLDGGISDLEEISELLDEEKYKDFKGLIGRLVGLNEDLAVML
ncbi:MAG: hypothetical protein HRT88_23840, partial [Lentisphaeraceae bacterium]|nr:hypothetical protein [Lentisphaeraceae bacterium]